METLEKLQAIIDLAPAGATHYEISGKYLKLGIDDAWYYARKRGIDGRVWDDVDCNNIGRYASISSLSDIKRIIGLEKKLVEK